MDGLIEPGLGARPAAGPISWGVGEVPGRGLPLRNMSAGAALAHELPRAGLEPAAGT